MKRCPTCDRTFDDTMTFCLVDGSVLGAPFDPEADPSYHTDQRELPETVMLPPPPREANDQAALLPETVAAATPRDQRDTSPPTGAPLKTIAAPPPELFDRAAQVSARKTDTIPPIESTESGRRASRVLVIVGLLIIAVVVIGAGLWWLRGRKSSPPVVASTEAPAKTENISQPTGKSFIETVNGVEIKMVSIPAGTFTMGSPASEAGRDADEGPQSNVTVENFYLGIYEVTQAQYRAVMGTNPSSSQGDNLPVDGVSWSDAEQFCRKLSQTTGRHYRLPTEAEWEYACRAGTTGPYAGKLDSMAWFESNAGGRTHPVGQMQANQFGLYDMYGNVWEWCQSKYKPYPYNADDGRENVQDNDVRVMRGGSWESSAKSCRSAYRRRVIPDRRTIGFRIALISR